MIESEFLLFETPFKKKIFYYNILEKVITLNDNFYC